MTGGSGFDATVPFSTPFDAPLVPTFPFRFRDVKILTAIYRTHADAVRRIVPEPLVCSDGLVAIHVYQMNDTDWFGAYNESAVQVRVSLGDKLPAGAYSPYLLLDNDGAISAGREVYGQPKRYGKPRIDLRQDLLVGTVARNDIDIITITAPYKTRQSSLDEMLGLFDFVVNVNLKVIPSADTGDGIREITMRRLSDVTVHGIWKSAGTVELRPHAFMPVHLLPVLEVLQVFYWHCDFSLGPAATIHKYPLRSA